LILLCGLLTLAGCRDGAAEVTGTVSYDNKPLTSGTVTILSEDGKERYSAVGPQGQYSVLGVPSGPVRFAVKSHAKIPTGLLRPGEKQLAAQIPARYEDPKTSELTANVRGGVFKHNLDLTP
jgi:hypothetical protein